jgi:hypothetical protein
MKNTTPTPSRPAKVRNALRGMRVPASLRPATRGTASRAAAGGRRAARAASTCLERELASYTSPSELKELDAILQRHTEEETADVRRILAARAAGRSDS